MCVQIRRVCICDDLFLFYKCEIVHIDNGTMSFRIFNLHQNPHACYFEIQIVYHFAWPVISPITRLHSHGKTRMVRVIRVCYKIVILMQQAATRTLRNCPTNGAHYLITICSHSGTSYCKRLLSFGIRKTVYFFAYTTKAFSSYPLLLVPL